MMADVTTKTEDDSAPAAAATDAAAAPQPAAGTPQATAPRAKNTRTLIGKVVSDSRAKTVTVLIERRSKHELYGKIVAHSSKYHAHDENDQYQNGDVVEIAEGRPISKTKSWIVTRLVQKGATV